MPTYEYECRKCGVFDHRQSIKDDPLKRCPRCRSNVQKLLSAPAFHLKGGGWYSDGYAKKDGSSNPPGSSDDGGKSADGTSSEAKPAGKSDKPGASGKSEKPGKSKTSKASKAADS
jgi:putative FmdB family regulatory protein